jgi:hypothetical protein
MKPLSEQAKRHAYLVCDSILFHGGPHNISKLLARMLPNKLLEVDQNFF